MANLFAGATVVAVTMYQTTGGPVYALDIETQWAGNLATTITVPADHQILIEIDLPTFDGRPVMEHVREAFLAAQGELPIEIGNKVVTVDFEVSEDMTEDELHQLLSTVVHESGMEADLADKVANITIRGEDGGDEEGSKSSEAETPSTGQEIESTRH